MGLTWRTNASAAYVRLESVADPYGHVGLRSQRQDARMKDFGAIGSERVSFVVAKIVEEPRLRRFIRVGGKDAVNVGPNHEFVGVQDVSDDGTGEIGAVAAESGNAAVSSRADKTGDNRDDAILEKRLQNLAPAPFGLRQMRLRIAKGVTRDHEIRRAHGNRRHAGTLKRGREQTCAEPLAERGEAIEELGGGDGVSLGRNFVEEITAQRSELIRDTVMMRGVETQMVENIAVKTEDVLGVRAGLVRLQVDKRMGNGEKAIGDALHGGDNDGDLRLLRHGPYQTGGVEHAFGAEQGAPAKLKCDYRFASAERPDSTAEPHA